MSSQNEDEDEERIRRFLDDSTGASPIKKLRKKVKWDLISQSLESPQKDDSLGLLDEDHCIEKNFTNNSSSQDFPKSSGKRSLDLNLKERKRIKVHHPGLNIFPQDPFKYFNSTSLDLEKDFGYKGRELLEKNDLGSFDELKKDPLELCLFLCPESKSLLVSNDNDFRAMCDFLFYSISSTTSDMEFDLYSKALGDLCTNYKAIWSIDFKKIMVSYLNLGCNETLLTNESIYKRMMKCRLEVVERIRKKKNKDNPKDRFSLNKASIFPKFVRLRSSDISKKYFQPLNSTVNHDLNLTKYDCLKRFTKFISQFMNTHKDRVCLIGPCEDWTGLLIMSYTMALVASDKGLFQAYPDLCIDIQKNLNIFLEAFSLRQWSGVEGNESSMDIEISGLCDMAKIFLYLGFCRNPDLKPWDPTSLPDDDYFQKELDHHHNLLFRISYLLPPTQRGTQLLKVTSFLTFQFLLNADKEIFFESSVTVHDLAKFLQDPIIKDRVISYFLKEHYLAWSLVRVIDFIVGNHPVLDFSKDLIPFVNSVSSFLQSCIRKLKDDIFDTNPSYLKEVVNQLLCKWNVLSLSSSKAVNAKITNFTVNKCS